MTTNDNEASRRAYWAEQMELGYAMVQKLIAFPVSECGERFASLPDAATAAGVEMQFSTSKIAGELDRVYFMRESLVRDVVEIGPLRFEVQSRDGYRVATTLVEKLDQSEPDLDLADQDVES